MSILEPIFTFRAVVQTIAELGKVKTGASNYGMA